MAETITVELTFATSDEAQSERLKLPASATVADALAASRFVGITAGALAIHGEVVETTTPLQDGDRIDLLRELLVDPMQARRQRAASATNARRKGQQ